MKKQYNYAFELLRQANYDKAELALQELLDGEAEIITRKAIEKDIT